MYNVRTNNCQSTLLLRSPNSMPNPHITVACVLKRLDKFLFVRERIEGRTVYNQPAGHLEKNETLIEAAKRETLEETGWEIEVTGFLGIYQYVSKSSGVCYIRHCFVGKGLNHLEEYQLDKGIIDTCWLSINEAELLSNEMRSPLVLQNLRDFIKKGHHPLSIISTEYWNSISDD